ncbi:WD domain, G-beta repeat [Gemmata obscuriglobus]|nr:WD40 repeat domain-containing protein [Gemmata obscuriglobus]QEG29793.1 WD domain, G-beta repeat [Gemmata obscuriglobus]VTS09110.1 wd40 repeat protein : Chromosome undetermined scaffold_238, whole genome shotgun sequence OS=Paramecium tetraurelia GN=GSPATT00038832001 PE=4 SV=1: WD40: WD40: WD40: WD40 [Gemmata obscuriglobus UQM 2246]
MLLFEDHRDETATVVHKAVVYAVAFSPDGSTLATGARDGSVFVRDAAGHVVPVLERSPKSSPVHALSFSPSGTALFVGGASGWYRYRQTESGWREASSKEVDSKASLPVTALTVLNEQTVAVGTGDRFKASGGALEIWDVSNDRKQSPHFTEPNGVRTIAVSPSKKIVAWGTGHRKVRVWDITTPKPMTEFPQASDCPAIALSSDGSVLAVASDRSTKLYDLRAKRERAVLKGHKGQVLCVAFSPDGRTVATGSFDFTVRLWDVATGNERASFKWDIGRVYCVSYAPDGFRLAAGGDLGRVVVWDAD